jgi:hypothetical protein
MTDGNFSMTNDMAAGINTATITRDTTEMDSDWVSGREFVTDTPMNMAAMMDNKYTIHLR